MKLSNSSKPRNTPNFKQPKNKTDLEPKTKKNFGYIRKNYKESNKKSNKDLNRK
jgi:hypothetical protein